MMLYAPQYAQGQQPAIFCNLSESKACSKPGSPYKQSQDIDVSYQADALYKLEFGLVVSNTLFE
ncbi:hypothetical protein PMAYCL1PPCAC_24705 [Pristionchus mayeri]|uniref:Uncharacterized protein n=1 Tax=Pristionchus mayeri TaxID=1317129 RepID=A0AAN5I7Y9_9BILA|nr:hypothetical protein PMAYCL1PPCAC_24705 [Pristionchus mayeri]